MSCTGMKIGDQTMFVRQTYIGRTNQSNPVLPKPKFIFVTLSQLTQIWYIIYVILFDIQLL